MRERKMGDLASRTLANTISSLLIAFFFFFSNFPYFRPFFAIFVALIATTALWEYYQLVRKKAVEPSVLIGLITAVIYVFAVFFQSMSGDLLRFLPSIILGLSFFAAFIFYALRGKDAILGLSTTFFGIFYIVVTLTMFIRIAYFYSDSGKLFEGSFWLLYLVATTKASDMGGYFIGRWMGKKKLAPKLSPNKTFEGAIAGVVCSILVSILCAYLGWKYGIFSELTLFTAIWLGAVMGIFGLLGDLSESLLKRDVDTKDSNTIPGVGGVLDMVDSLLFTAPILYIFLTVSL